ncbi:MAG: PAS domain S-box protein [Ktedonobacteraceae bacterium]|nr:PAS domain S-box protein [Ktedonobacteraceae bacterium]
MSWFQTRQSVDIHDQMAILIGSAVRLLCGEAGVFVVANEVFDPQSTSEYSLYRLSEEVLPTLLADVQEGVQPNSLHPFVIEPVAPSLAIELGMDEDVVKQQGIVRCSLLLYDRSGPVGVLHFLRRATARSCFEQHSRSAEGEDALYLRLFIALLTASLRFALQSQSLVSEQARFAAIFQHSAEGMLTVDGTLRIADWNPAMERLTGWRESEVRGRFYFEVLRPRDRQGRGLGLQDSPILQAFAGQTVINREMIILSRDGQPVHVAVTATCVRSSRGEPVNGILNVRDLTREREREEQRSTFISVISHELQTPIAIIKGYASTLAHASARLDAASLQPRLVAIEEEADRLNKLVGNLLYASRIQAGGLQMDIASLDLESLIESVVRRLKAKSPDVSFTLDIPADLPIVKADRDRIEEVLLNLLDNAIKYSPRQRTITVAARATGEEVIVSVSDAGMGISLRDQQQIFDRFQRADNRVTQAMPGAGLGLYISRAIVEAHGGRIWVESTLHQGSTFSFSLPREEKAQLPMVVF